MGCHVSVLMPAYNEADNLVEVIPSTVAALERLGQPWEILVVDDGSTDETRRVMAELRSNQVRYIRLRRNSGKSSTHCPRRLAWQDWHRKIVWQDCPRNRSASSWTSWPSRGRPSRGSRGGSGDNKWQASVVK